MIARTLMPRFDHVILLSGAGCIHPKRRLPQSNVAASLEDCCKFGEGYSSTRNRFLSLRCGFVFSRLMIGLGAFLLIATMARAEFATPTLQRIAETGKIRIGYGATAPFAFQTPEGQVVGYSIDICRRLTERLKERLQLAAIEIEFVPRTPSNRIQLLKDGSMDIECNASTNNEERRRSASFSYSHFYSATRYVSLARNGLSALDDLKGRSVSVALGTVNVGEINEINRARKLNVSLVPVDGIQSAFDMVSDGRVSAFAMDEVLLSMMIAQSGTAENYRLSTEIVMDTQPFGFMMRLNDTAFTDAVNEELRSIYASPEMAEIYRRWFENPMPSRNVNLHMPMGERLKANFANPEILP